MIMILLLEFYPDELNTIVWKGEAVEMCITPLLLQWKMGNDVDAHP